MTSADDAPAIIRRVTWSDDNSTGRGVTLTLWRTRSHQWELEMMCDRVHRNGNYLWRVEFIRISRR